jgi:transposase-like protein
VLGVSCALLETKVNWRAFFENLFKRGMSGVQFVVSDDQFGSKGGEEVRVWVGYVVTLPF